MKEYIKVKGENSNAIQVKLEYELGGYQYSTCKNKPRGYYISVQPMFITDRGNGVISYSYTGWTGYYQLLAECKRRSKSAEDKAKTLYEDAKNDMIKRVCEEQNLILEENE